MRVVSIRQIGSLIACFSVMISLSLLVPNQALAVCDDLPKAENLLDKNVASTGGKDAHLGVKTRKMTGTLAYDIGGHKMKGKVTVSQAPNKYHMMIESDHLSMVRATNGDQVWEWRAGHEGDEDSTTLLTGPEKNRTIEQAQIHATANWRKRFKEYKTTGSSTVNEKPAYEVLVTTNDDEKYSQFFDQASGRLAKIARKIKSSQFGEIETEIFFGDYQKVDGLWLPMKVTHKMDLPGVGAGTQTFTYSEIKHEEKLPASLFEVPEELIQKDKSK